MRPYIICHMTTSIDGSVAEDFFYAKESDAAVETYYEIHRMLKEKAQGFVCGKITMQKRFCGDERVDLSKYQNRIVSRKDYVANKEASFYAVAMDRNGSLNWEENTIYDEYNNFNNAHVIEVLCENVDDAYLAYLKAKGISYLFGGVEEIDIHLVLEKLYTLFHIETLLLEGGSTINGVFQNADVIDELSLVLAPLTSKRKDKPLFVNGGNEIYTLKKVKKYKDSIVWLNYQKEV